MSEHVIIVEDEPDIAELVVLHLQREGYRTSVYHDGERALEAIRELHPDLVVLDLMLPGLGGFEICRAMRRDDRLEDVPVQVYGDTLLERYAGDRLAEGGAPRTVRLELRVLGAAWRWAAKAGRVPLIAADAPTIKAERWVENHRTPSDDEIRRTLAELEGEDRLAGLLLWHTGARVGEVVGSPLRLDGPRTLLVDGKTGPRRVPIPLELAQELRRHLAEHDAVMPRRADGQPYTRPEGAMRLRLLQAAERAGVDPWTPHGARRAMVQRLRRAGVDPKTAASLMGHTVTVMLRLYAETSDEDLERAAGLAREALEEELTPKVVRGPWGER